MSQKTTLDLEELELELKKINIQQQIIKQKKQNKNVKTKTELKSIDVEQLNKNQSIKYIDVKDDAKDEEIYDAKDKKVFSNKMKNIYALKDEYIKFKSFMNREQKQFNKATQRYNKSKSIYEKAKHKHFHMHEKHQLIKKNNKKHLDAQLYSVLSEGEYIHMFRIFIDEHNNFDNAESIQLNFRKIRNGSFTDLDIETTNKINKYILSKMHRNIMLSNLEEKQMKTIIDINKVLPTPRH